MDTRDFITEISGRVHEDFAASRRVLTFDEYLDEVAARPEILLRSAAQYLDDAIGSFGRSTIDRVYGRVQRHHLYDMEASGGRGRVVGQEEVQEEIAREVSHFARQGQTTRLILLHGPNGSAKTSLVQALAKALVEYSYGDDGVLYRFNWIFPTAATQGKHVGFASVASEAPSPGASYARLDPQAIAAAVPNELRDHPIFLLSKAARSELLELLTSEGRLSTDFSLSDHVGNGDLGPMSRQIYDTLFTASGGDLAAVLRHIQVERFYLSRRYRRGVVTIEPQLHVDAKARQLTMEESYANLPAVLRHLSFWQFSGDLVDANRGLVEFSDLLKRPPESFKYLLSSTEKAAVPVGDSVLYVDVVYMGTTNDQHLAGFKQSQDFSSFKARLQLIRVPYIRDYRVEQEIYDHQLTEVVVGRHVAPHASELVALWGVLTRMRKPDPAGYPAALQDIVKGLTPMDKARLYAERRIPATVPLEQRRDFLAIAPDLYREFDGEQVYEGAFGASPRELRAALLSAAGDEEFGCLHPLACFRAIDALIRDPSLYHYLQIKPDAGYHDAAGFLVSVQDRYAELVNEEVRDAMNLVTGENFTDLLQRYAHQVSAWLKGQRVVNPVTGKEEEPDEAFLVHIEDLAGNMGDRRATREQFMGRVAARSLERIGEALNYDELFADLLGTMRTNYFESHRAEIHKRVQDALVHLDGEDLPDDRGPAAAAFVDRLVERHGYCRACAAPALSFLLKEVFK
ncbi:MAG: serine protein kinase PrkA [Pseudomonadota bacterium]